MTCILDFARRPFIGRCPPHSVERARGLCRWGCPWLPVALAAGLPRWAGSGWPWLWQARGCQGLSGSGAPGLQGSLAPGLGRWTAMLSPARSDEAMSRAAMCSLGAEQSEWDLPTSRATCLPPRFGMRAPSKDPRFCTGAPSEDVGNG